MVTEVSWVNKGLAQRLDLPHITDILLETHSVYLRGSNPREEIYQLVFLHTRTHL